MCPGSKQVLKKFEILRIATILKKKMWALYMTVDILNGHGKGEV